MSTQETPSTTDATTARAADRPRVPGVEYLTDPTDGVELVTPLDAAVISHCSIRTIYNWIAWGWVAVRFTPAGRTRVVVESLMQATKQRIG